MMREILCIYKREKEREREKVDSARYIHSPLVYYTRSIYSGNLATPSGQISFRPPNATVRNAFAKWFRHWNTPGYTSNLRNIITTEDAHPGVQASQILHCRLCSFSFSSVCYQFIHTEWPRSKYVFILHYRPQFWTVRSCSRHSHHCSN